MSFMDAFRGRGCCGKPASGCASSFVGAARIDGDGVDALGDKPVQGTIHEAVSRHPCQTVEARARNAHGEVTPFEAGRPVVFDRVLIMPGDLIYADSSGAVVIPAAESVAVVNLAREIAGEETNALGQIADEESGQR